MIPFLRRMKMLLKTNPAELTELAAHLKPEKPPVVMPHGLTVELLYDTMPALPDHVRQGLQEYLHSEFELIRIKRGEKAWNNG
jgi:hypothetical protein